MRIHLRKLKCIVKFIYLRRLSLEHGLADTITWGEFIKKSKNKNPHSEIKLPPLTDEPGCTETISPDEFFVQILDPATGTATFPVEVIDVIYNYLKDLCKKCGVAAMPFIPDSKSNISNFTDYWNEYVPKALLPRLHAYELMMAPYAIAHMKVGLKLAETGYHFATEERARIYLTNALEPWQKQLPLIGFDALAHEAAAVNEIKRHKRFTVIIGNPPYSGISSNKSESALRIVDAYRFVDGAALNAKKLWLQDDYVKFMRKAQTTIETTRFGVLGYITNHGYLDNPTFCGMRQSLMGTFPRLRVIDLHGNSKKTSSAPDGSADMNVFDIQQGVSVALFSTPFPHAASSQKFHSELWGARESKYHFLATNTSKSTLWNELHPEPEFYLLVPHNVESKDEYEQGWKITDIFPVNGTGVVTGRDSMTIDFDHLNLWSRITDFAKSSEAEARANYGLGKDARDWTVKTAQADVRASGPHKSKLFPILYRPFDFRFTYYTGHSRGFYASPCSKVMQNMASRQNLGIVWTRPMSPQFEFTVCVSKTIADQCSVGNKSAGAGISYLAPLRVSRGEVSAQGKLSLDSTNQPNFGQPFLRRLSAMLNLSRTGLDGIPAGLTPEDIFHYIYAVFHSPGYRSRYAEFLKIDFPRLPLTGNLELFRALARLGGELTALHLLESPKLDKPITEFIGKSKEVTKIGWTDDTVWINAGGTRGSSVAGTSGFRGVPAAVWHFHIGGYQVCEKWLKDRKGRTLTADDIAHYQKIIIALTETIRLMTEIDEVIEIHGGWPGAFPTSVGTESAPPDNSPLPPAVSPKSTKPKASPGSAFIPGELFGVEGELKPAKKAKAARKAAKKAAKPQPASAPRSNPAPDKNDLMALIREIMAKHSPCDRNTLTKHCAQAMGYQRVVQSVAETITNAIRTAKRRGIVEEEHGTLRLDRTPLDQWDRTFLKTQFLATLNQNGRIWLKREDTTRLLARWFGFRRTGHIIEETTRSLINGLLRDRSIEKNGQDWIRRV